MIYQFGEKKVIVHLEWQVIDHYYSALCNQILVGWMKSRDAIRSDTKHLLPDDSDLLDRHLRTPVDVACSVTTWRKWISASTVSLTTWWSYNWTLQHWSSLQGDHGSWLNAVIDWFSGFEQKISFLVLYDVTVISPDCLAR